MPIAAPRLPDDEPVIRFGPFELRTATRELCRGKQVVRLSGLPFEVLAALVERPGSLVTREELRRRLWPDGTFVDFDNSLNNAVNRLRQVLGDSAEEPRYIETLPRLGYRFIADVAFKTAEAAAMASAAPAGTEASTVTTESKANTVAPSAIEPAQVEHESAVQPSRATARLQRIRAVLYAAAFVLAAVAAVLAWRYWSAPAASARRTLVVLPFEDLAAPGKPSFLTDGLTEELITELARINPDGLGVIARTTAFRYRGTEKSIAEISRELGVDYVIEGSVRVDGARARVVAQLIEAEGQSHVWAASYDRDLVDLLSVERDLATAVASAVHLSVDTGVRRRREPRSVDARQAYLEGRYYYGQGTVAATEQAILAYRRAIALEPDLALAHAGLARSLVFSTRTAPEEALEAAKIAAAQARVLDPALPEAQLAWAIANLYGDRDLNAAEREFRQAIALDAGNPDAHFYYAQMLTAAGRFDEALASARRALALDPFSMLVHHYIGRILIFARRPDEALAHLRETLEIEPNYGWGLLFSAVAHEQRREWAEAVRMRQRYWQVMGVESARVNRLGELFAASGYAAVQREWAAWIEGFANARGFVTSSELGMLYAGLGERDRAFEWLERAVNDRTRDLIYLRVYAELDALRNDPRWLPLVARALPGAK